MDDAAEQSKMTSSNPSLAAVGTVQLEYSSVGADSRFNKPWWVTFLASCGVIVAIGLIAMQIIHVLVGISSLEQPRSTFAASPPGAVSQPTAAGLHRWQTLTLIALSLVGILVSTMLLTASSKMWREQSGTLKWMRRYALWQIISVIPTAAVVVLFAKEIAWNDFGDSSPGRVNEVCAWAIVQAFIAIGWSGIILVLTHFAQANSYWKLIESSEGLIEASVATETAVDQAT